MVEAYQGIDEQNRIAIIGPMGSGKGTVARELAMILGYVPSPDLDDDGTLTLTHGLTIPEFINQFDSGKQPFPIFRRLESKAVKKLLYEYRFSTDIVFSLGGGTITDHDELQRNIWMLRKMGFTIIYNKTDIERILDFKKDDGVGNEKRLPVNDRELLEKREPTYLRESDIVIENIGTIEDTALKTKNGYFFYKEIIPIRGWIDEIDDELIKRFKGKNLNYTSEYSSSKEEYPSHNVMDFRERIYQKLRDHDIDYDEKIMQLISSRLEFVEEVAELKNKYGESAVQKGRKEELENKWMGALGEKGQIIYKIIHDMSVELEKEIMNQK